MLKEDNQDSVHSPLKSGLQFGVIGTLVLLVVLTPSYFTTSLSTYNIPKIALVQILTTLACSLWFIRMAIDGKLSLVQSPLYYAFLSFLAANFISLFQAYNRPVGLETMFQYICNFLLCLVVFNCVKVEGERRVILWGIVFTASVVSVIGLLQYHRVYAFSSKWSLPVSTLGNMTFVAEYLDITLPIAVALMVVSRGFARWLAGGALLSMLVLISVLGARGGWIGMVVSSGIFIGALIWRAMRVGIRLRKGSIFKYSVSSIIVVLLIVFGMSIPLGERSTVGMDLKERVLDTFGRFETAVHFEDDSTRQRFFLWRDTAKMIRERLWFGVGVGNFPFNIPVHMSADSIEILQRMRKNVEGDLVLYGAHNDYLQVLAETGILGLAAFLWMFYVISGISYRLLRSYANGKTNMIGVALVAGSAATLVHALFSSNFQNPASASNFWIVIGLAAVLDRQVSGLGEQKIPILEIRSVVSILILACVSFATFFIGLAVSYNTVIADYSYTEGWYDWKARNVDPNRLVQATENFAKSISYRPYYFGAHQMLGLTFYDMRLWLQAEKSFKRSLQCHPNNRMVNKLRGEALMQLGRYQEAIVSFKNAIQLEPGFAEAYFRLGYCLRQLGRHEEAIEAHSEAVRLEPGNIEYLNSLGVDRIKMGDYKGAIEDLNRAAKANPRHASVLLNLGNAHSLLGNSKEALNFYNRVIDFDPGDYIVYALAGQVYQEQLKDFKKAREFFEKARSIAPDDPRIVRLLNNLDKEANASE